MKKIIFNLFVITLSINVWAKMDPNAHTGNGAIINSGDDRAAGCDVPNDIMYLNYNNVKALIMTGGMMWQDRASSNASYIVANPQNAHVIYAGALWMGGVDVNGQLKLAAQTFGSNGRDFWTGPLSTFGGNPGNYDPSVVQTSDLNVVRAYGDAEIISDECAKYDNFYTIRKREVIDFDRWWQCTYGANPDPAVCEDIEEIDPEVLQRILDWPAHGDPALGQDEFLAPFYDRDGDKFYDPIGDGDYPWYDLNGEIDCRNDRRVTLFGDETNWWIFNDKGNIHTETGGDPIGMEVRAQAFAFATNDAINDMTFYNYEMINRSTQTLYNTYFAQWVDADVGGSSDDFVGCDVSRGLGFAYNGDAVDDGSGGLVFGEHPPAIGVDFFEGPYQDLDQIDNPLTTNVQDAVSQKGIPYEGLGLGYGDGLVDNERLGMRRFVYYNIGGGVQGDPNAAADYYGLMNGFWKTSGIDITYGGTGLGGSLLANYMFPGETDPLFWGTQGVSTSPWSEESESNSPGDRRFLEVAGPFTLLPGAVNNLTVGVVYGRDLNGDNLASVKAMKSNDSKAQALFDACFEIVEPPLAPELTVQEMENELILFVSDQGGIIENYQAEDVLNIPKYDDQGNLNDRYYRFQGYQIYQMVDEDVSVSDIGDETKAILVAQCDLEDDVTKLVNYTYDEQNEIPVAEVKVSNADNAGIVHSFHITEDQFATGNKALVNHKKYYFIAIAYAHNEYKPYDPFDAGYLDGQKLPYLASRQSLTGGSIKAVEAIPHNPAPEAGGTVWGTYYGYQPKITQVDGIGNGGNFVEIDSNTENSILENNTIDAVTYKAGAGPVNVKVIDPLNLQNGTYTIGFPNDAASVDFRISDTVKWYITRTFEGVSETITADYGIGTRNEHLFPEWGISVDITQQVYLPKIVNGVASLATKGDAYIDPIGATIEYEDSSLAWLSQVSDNDISYPTNWIMCGINKEAGLTVAPEQWIYNPQFYNDVEYVGYEQKYEKLLDGGISPFRFVNFKVYGSPFGARGTTFYEDGGNLLGAFKPSTVKRNLVDLHDIDIVITSDQSKWTRCPVFEINDNETQTIGGADKMDLRASNSVGKDGAPDASGTTGMGWFPGYAIDINTGERLNMAFSENSWLSADNGADMIWNPTSTYIDATGLPVFGGMQYVYVFNHSSDMPVYDEGQTIYSIMSDPTYNGNDYKNLFDDLGWIWEPVLNEGHEFMETDVRVKVRINKPYTTNELTPKSNDGRPLYNFTIDDEIRVITNNEGMLKDSVLSMINIVPNPYYAYSSYESNRLDTRVKITNLPEQCEITIFNMQGALVRQYSKDDPMTSLDWDLKNHKGIPIAGGVYIIHIDVPGVGERVLKWYGVLRAPDLQNF